MKKIVILITVVIVISIGFLSGCMEQSLDEGDSKDIVEQTHFTVSGTITNNYAEDVDVDYSIVENYNEWSYWAPTIHIPSYEVKGFSCEVKLGYEQYILMTQWFYPNTDSEGCLTVSENIKDPTGVDLGYYIEIKSDGEIEISKTEPELTTNKAPNVLIDASITLGNAPLTVSFTSEAVDSDGSIVNYSWDFKDGETSNEEKPTHTFQSYGTFNVKLTVTDDKGATSFDTIIIKSQFPDPELVTHGFVEPGSYTRVFGLIKNVGLKDIKLDLPKVTFYDASDNYITSNNLYDTSYADAIAPEIICPKETAIFTVEVRVSWIDHYEIDVTYTRTTQESFKEKNNLEITESSIMRGHVKNVGSSVVTDFFKVVGAFYDADGTLLYVDADNIYSDLYSGQSKAFSFDFSFNKPFLMTDITNYDVKIGPYV